LAVRTSSKKLKQVLKKCSLGKTVGCWLPNSTLVYFIISLIAFFENLDGKIDAILIILQLFARKQIRLFPKELPTSGLWLLEKSSDNSCCARFMVNILMAPTVLTGTFRN